MAAGWFVTVQAIVRFLVQARKSISSINEANGEMKNAAAELCSVWKGRAAETFAAEQGVLSQYCAELVNVSTDYTQQIEQAKRNIDEAVEKSTQAIRG